MELNIAHPYVLLISGPSGVGKGTLVQPTVLDCPQLGFSVSCTTRDPREGEVDGREYHFISDAEFTQQVDQGAFVEWAHVHGRRYGTRHADVEAFLASGRIPVLDIDVQGGVQVLDYYGDRVVSVFVFPPSWEELERRLRKRGTESDESIALRLENAHDELTQVHHYGYYIVNDDSELARAQLGAILVAEGLRRDRWIDPPL